MPWCGGRISAHSAVPITLGAAVFRRLVSPVVLPFAFLTLLAAAGPANAQDPDFLAFSIGGFDVNDDETAGEARLEYRSDIRLWFAKPFSGLMVNTDAGVYGYGGFLVDLFFGRRWVVTPSLAVGLYSDGSGKDLGSTVEFRSQVEFAFRFASRSRIGISLNHVSNAGLDDVNPGTEEIVLTYAVPFSVFLGR